MTMSYIYLLSLLVYALLLHGAVFQKAAFWNTVVTSDCPLLAISLFSKNKRKQTFLCRVLRNALFLLCFHVVYPTYANEGVAYHDGITTTPYVEGVIHPNCILSLSLIIKLGLVFFGLHKGE
jgi:hypothetical protein